MKPRRFFSSLESGVARHQSGRYQEAEKFYHEALVDRPQCSDALHLLGTVALQLKRYAVAVALFKRALQIDSNLAICHMRLALAQAALGFYVDAERSYKEALGRDSSSAETWNNLAITLEALGRIGDAVSAYRRAIQLRGDFVEAYRYLGMLISNTRGPAAGLPYFCRAAELQPNDVESWCLVGLALVAVGKNRGAEVCLNRALRVQPEFLQAKVGLGGVFLKTYRLFEAIATFNEVLASRPDHYASHSARLMCLNYLDNLNRQKIFAEHESFGRMVGSPSLVQEKSGRLLHSRLRVAFLSPDLRQHPIAYFLEPILRNLDPARIEVVLYHDHFRSDAVSDRLYSYASKWRNFAGLDNDFVGKCIREDAPDILIDLAGHTEFNRLPLLAKRVAPVQINYLGYPNTTGVAAMDFRFVDKVTDGTDVDQAFCVEKLVRFAPCAWAYQPPENAPEPRMPSPEFVTFGSCNNFAKISDYTLRLWARVLAAVPNSRLLLKWFSLNEPGLSSLIQAKLALLQVDRSRIELVGHTPTVESHLAAYHRIDIALDTFPYHGTTTTCEALWMGVPLVTLIGDRHASRVSASLLTAIGRPEWIAASDEDYINLAAALAADRAARIALRASLRNEMSRSLLLDHALHAQRFAEALVGCVQEKMG